MRRVVLMLLVWSCWTVQSVVADDLADLGRGILNAHENSVVTIRCASTLKVPEVLRMAGLGGGDTQVEAYATILDPSGLAVAASAAVNPHRTIGAVVEIAGELGQEKQGSGRVTNEITSVKYRLNDGTEFPGRVVLEDATLGLLFVAPRDPLPEPTRAKFSSIKLDGTTPAVRVLDPVFAVERLEKLYDYQVGLVAGRVKCKISRPRTAWVVEGIAAGCPVFTTEGKLLGIGAMRLRDHEADGGGAGMVESLNAMNQAIKEATQHPIILPAEELARLVAQAKMEMAKPAAKE